MLLRTPRRRISPRSKRRCRVIRNFFLRALGTSSQQDLKINSSIALNVTDIHHKYGTHCHDFASRGCSPRKKEHGACKYEGETSCTEEIHTTSTVTRVLYEPRSRDNFQTSDGPTLEPPDHESPRTYESSAENKNITLPSGVVPALHPPYQTKVRKKRKKYDDESTTTDVCECNRKLHKHRTKSALETVTPDYSSSCYWSPRLASVKRKNRPRRNLDRNRIEPPPPGENNTVINEKDNTKRNKSSPERPIVLQKGPIEGNNNIRKSKSKNRLVDKNFIEEIIKIQYMPTATEQQKVPVEDKHETRKIKSKNRLVDKNFIQEIIKTQYMPTEIPFGRKPSDFSQFSEPVCRDRELPLNVPEELCSCAYEPCSLPPTHTRSFHRSRNNSPSACDTRSPPPRTCRSRSHYTHYDTYNDANLYDIIPVKEKCSPKSRRKHAEDAIMNYEMYREVPPSPRTHRPKLNLEAQLHSDYEEFINTKRLSETKKARRRHRKLTRREDTTNESEATLQLPTCRQTKLLKPAKVQTSVSRKHDTPPLSGRLQNMTVINEHETSKPRHTEDPNVSCRKDKTLSDIKDILQNFLEEIKKETLHADREEDNKNLKQFDNTSGKPVTKGEGVVTPDTTAEARGVTLDTPLLSTQQAFMPDLSSPVFIPGVATTLPTFPIPCVSGLSAPISGVTSQVHTMPTSTQDGHAYNTYTVAHCNVPTSFPMTFSGTCCYPAPPMCAGVCTASHSNHHCHPGDTSHIFHTHNTSSSNAFCQNCCNKKDAKPGNERNTETDELIKEIHKFVTLNPTKQNQESLKNSSKLTSRSVGSSHRASRHDVDVMTSKLRCYSKSCEAIGYRTVSDTSYTTRSETMLEKFRLDIPYSDNETPEAKGENQSKKKKFSDVLKSIFKKKKMHISETTPTGSYYANENTPRYMATAQEYFKRQRTPSPPRRPHGHPSEPSMGFEHYEPYSRPPPGIPRIPQGYRSPNHWTTSSTSEYISHPLHAQTIPENEPTYGLPYYDPRERPSCHHPQMPLFLREIEVKNIGIQSERKRSFLSKLALLRPRARSASTVTRIETPSQSNQNQYQYEYSNKVADGWKKFQEKIESDLQREGFRGKKNLRKMILKKMFHNKNPFHKNNLLLRTLLRNDPGEVKLNTRNRLFF